MAERFAVQIDGNPRGRLVRNLRVHDGSPHVCAPRRCHQRESDKFAVEGDAAG